MGCAVTGSPTALASLKDRFQEAEKYNFTMCLEKNLNSGDNPHGCHRAKQEGEGRKERGR